MRHGDSSYSKGMTMPPPPPPFQDPSAMAGAYGAPGAPQTAIAYASWINRVLAALIDSVPGIVIGQILALFGTAASLLGNLVSLGLGLYFAYLGGQTGQSPGKKVMGIQVVNAKTGQFIGGGMGIVRNLAHILDAIPCGLGFLLPLIDKQKQTIADKVLSTVVIEGPKQDFVTAFKSVIPNK
jgi:uncharacterized RDD family membrane protein YckC